MKNKNILTVILFCGLIVTFFLTHILSQDIAFSENENRVLQKLPSFSIKELFEGDFTSDFETYVNDQFPLRNGWIGLNTLAEKILLKHDTNGVYFAKDGYIIEKFSSYDKNKFEANAEHIINFAKKYDFPVYNMMIPTSGFILDNKLPGITDEVNQSILIRFFDKYSENNFLNIDTTDILSNNKDKDIYYRTDHHYTSLGAYYCYKNFLESKNELPLPLAQFNKKVLTEDFYGTLYSKLLLPWVKPENIIAYETDVEYTVEYNMNGVLSNDMYEEKYLDGKDKYSVFLNANQALSVIRTENKNNKRLIVIKDSFANTMIQFLIPHYEEIHVIDLRYFRMKVSEYISDNQINQALMLYNIKNFCEDNNLYSLEK